METTDDYIKITDEVEDKKSLNELIVKLNTELLLIGMKRLKLLSYISISTSIVAILLLILLK
jgi:hypothetical protein